MGEPQPTVFVVDDDPSIRKSLERLIKASGVAVASFDCADAFLAQVDADRPGCLLLDIRMPGKSGLVLQDELRTRGVSLPIIVITGHGDVDVAVRAMKAGAFDFLEKPFNPQGLLEVVQSAIRHDADLRKRLRTVANFAERVKRLSPREREVLDELVAGETLKRVAFSLGISYKTAQVHRARILEKLEMTSMAEVLRAALLHSDLQNNPR